MMSSGHFLKNAPKEIDFELCHNTNPDRIGKKSNVF